MDSLLTGLPICRCATGVCTLARYSRERDDAANAKGTACKLLSQPNSTHHTQLTCAHKHMESVVQCTNPPMAAVELRTIVLLAAQRQPTVNSRMLQSKPNLARVGDDNTASMRCTPSREQAHHDRRVANRCIALHNTTQTTAAQRRWSNTVGRVRASPTMPNATCTSAACACTHAKTCTTPTQHTRRVLSVCTTRDPPFSAHTRHRAESRFSHRAARNHCRHVRCGRRGD